MEWLYHYLPAAIFSIGAVWFGSVMVFAGIVNTGSIVGTAVCLCLATAFWNFHRTANLLVKTWHTLPGKIALSIATIVAVLLIMLAILLSVCMIKAVNHKPPVNADYPVIVLGCKVNGDTPSRMLRYRLEAAKAYLECHPDAVCVVSGGQGDNEAYTEGSVMKKWLLSHGIAADRILAEEKSQNTQQNLMFSKKMLMNAGIDCENAVIVTDAYHQYRASLYAKKVELIPYAHAAKTDFHLVPIYWVREWFGLCKYFVFQNGR